MKKELMVGDIVAGLYSELERPCWSAGSHQDAGFTPCQHISSRMRLQGSVLLCDTFPFRSPLKVLIRCAADWVIFFRGNKNLLQRGFTASVTPQWPYRGLSGLNAAGRDGTIMEKGYWWSTMIINYYYCSVNKEWWLVIILKNCSAIIFLYCNAFIGFVRLGDPTTCAGVEGAGTPIRHCRSSHQFYNVGPWRSWWRWVS